MRSKRVDTIHKLPFNNLVRP